VHITVDKVLSASTEEMLFCGMSIDHKDQTVAYIRTGRAALDETVTFVDG
jgi:hypothetical protein